MPHGRGPETQKQRLSIYKIQKVYFCWKKSPCGSAPRSTKLRKYMFYVFKTQKSRFYVSKIENLCFCWKKKPLRERTQEHRTWKVIYIFLIYRNLYLPHIICIFETYICICNTYFCVCNTYNLQKSRFQVSDNRCACFGTSENDGFGSEMGRR